MALLVPVLGIPLGLTAGFYTWKWTYQGVCHSVGVPEEQRSTTGAILGGLGTFAGAGVGSLVFSHLSSGSASVPVKPQGNVEFSGKQLWRGSKKLSFMFLGVWYASAVVSALTACNYSDPQTIEHKANKK